MAPHRGGPKVFGMAFSFRIMPASRPTRPLNRREPERPLPLLAHRGVADNRGSDREGMSGGLLSFQKPDFKATELNIGQAYLIPSFQ
jgi:hypothetical protein